MPKNRIRLSIKDGEDPLAASTAVLRKLDFLRNHILGKKRFVLLVYSPHCGHCVSLKSSPELKSAHSAWHNFTHHRSMASTPVVEVDDKAMSLIRAVVGGGGSAQTIGPALHAFINTLTNVRGYPTIMKVSESLKFVEYQKDRSSKALVTNLATA